MNSAVVHVRVFLRYSLSISVMVRFVLKISYVYDSQISWGHRWDILAVCGFPVLIFFGLGLGICTDWVYNFLITILF
jgi:hypothetical protein